MVTGRTHVATIRRDQTKAAAVLAVIFPEARARQQALRILADTINRAHRVAPASWGVSLFHNRLCLNVSRGAVLQFYPGEIMFILTGRRLKSVPASARRAFRINRRYKFVKDSVEGRLPVVSLKVYSKLAAAHLDLVERAAQGRKICFWKGAHAPAIPGLLRTSGLAVPDPDYVTAGEPKGIAPAPDLDELDRATAEGRRTLRTHLAIERHSGLAERKRRWALATRGTLSCEVCGFDFLRRYGSIGDGFAEVHHRVPLGHAVGERKTRLKHLAVVCSNCHRMLHRGNPLFSIAKLRARLSTSERGA